MRFRILSIAVLLLASANVSAAGPTGLNGLLAPVDRLVSSVVTGLLGNVQGQLLVLPPLPAIRVPGLVPLPAVPIPVTGILEGLNVIPVTVRLLDGIAPLVTVVPLPIVTPIFSDF